jgi:hypothetical protein
MCKESKSLNQILMPPAARGFNAWAPWLTVTPLECGRPKAWRSSLLGLVHWRPTQVGRQFHFGDRLTILA